MCVFIHVCLYLQINIHALPQKFVRNTHIASRAFSSMFHQHHTPFPTHHVSTPHTIFPHVTNPWMSSIFTPHTTYPHYALRSHSTHHTSALLDVYCSTVQGLLDWFDRKKPPPPGGWFMCTMFPHQELQHTTTHYNTLQHTVSYVLCSLIKNRV